MFTITSDITFSSEGLCMKRMITNFLVNIIYIISLLIIIVTRGKFNPLGTKITL